MKILGQFSEKWREKKLFLYQYSSLLYVLNAGNFTTLRRPTLCHQTSLTLGTIRWISDRLVGWLAWHLGNCIARWTLKSQEASKKTNPVWKLELPWASAKSTLPAGVRGGAVSTHLWIADSETEVPGYVAAPSAHTFGLLVVRLRCRGTRRCCQHTPLDCW